MKNLANSELAAKTAETWRKGLESWHQPVERIAKLKESEGDFKSRLQVLLHEKRDAEMEKIRRKYTPKLTSLQEQLRKAEARVEKEKDQYGLQKVSTAISFGTTIRGALLGRGAMSVGTVGPISSSDISLSRLRP